MRIAWTHKLAAGAIVALIGLALGAAGAAAPTPALPARRPQHRWRANNVQHRTWGKAGLAYRRVAPANYADGRSHAGDSGQARPLRQQPDLQRRRPEPVLRDTACRSGGGCGASSSIMTSGSASSRGTESSPLPFDRNRSSGAVHERPRRARLHPYPGAGAEHDDDAPAEEHDHVLPGRVDGLRLGRDPGHVAARWRIALPARRIPSAGRRQGQSRRRWTSSATRSPRPDARSSPATRGRTRTSASPTPRRSSLASTTASCGCCRPSSRPS